MININEKKIDFCDSSNDFYEKEKKDTIDHIFKSSFVFYTDRQHRNNIDEKDIMVDMENDIRRCIFYSGLTY